MRRCKPFSLALLWAVLCQLALAGGAEAAQSLIKSDPRENQPLDLAAKGAGHANGGGDLLRTVVGLLIVLALIWALAWVLKRIKQGGPVRAGGGIEPLASLSLGSGRSVQLLKAGNDYLLVGVGEHAVYPLHRYTEQEARAAGLLSLSAENPLLSEPDHPAFGAAPQGLVERLRRWTVRR